MGSESTAADLRLTQFELENGATGFGVKVTLEAPVGTVVVDAQPVDAGRSRTFPIDVRDARTVLIRVAADAHGHESRQQIECSGRPWQTGLLTLRARFFPGSIHGTFTAGF